MSHQGPRHSYRQELHNYLQAIYRNSNVLEIPAQPVSGGVWRADVFIYGNLVAQATAMSAADAREEAAARALLQHRGCYYLLRDKGTGKRMDGAVKNESTEMPVMITIIFSKSFEAAKGGVAVVQWLHPLGVTLRLTSYKMLRPETYGRFQQASECAVGIHLIRTGSVSTTQWPFTFGPPSGYRSHIRCFGLASAMVISGFGLSLHYVPVNIELQGARVDWSPTLNGRWGVAMVVAHFRLGKFAGSWYSHQQANVNRFWRPSHRSTKARFC
ncbi:hypothetical protein FIBSPDRAFT_1025556 [Athelia psychrophila]|uniref:Uncharacterized protein n=1 Tax=Athelia psychrophila TaxID=1759441 RepID=A0A166HWW1_9AGAM|nr:hypothetical protein FIBSPDRAFT_1025556 [Fibularhizoctonia sp. CBS 109695]